jgi:hypothetical protein
VSARGAGSTFETDGDLCFFDQNRTVGARAKPIAASTATTPSASRASGVQAASDVFLGWIHPRKPSTVADGATYRSCGPEGRVIQPRNDRAAWSRTLRPGLRLDARWRARSRNRIAIAAYLGKAASSIEHTDFAVVYADQGERDHTTRQAVHDGRIKRREGL